MSHLSRVMKANPEEIPADLVDLSVLLNQLPIEHREQVEPIMFRVVEGTKSPPPNSVAGARRLEPTTARHEVSHVRPGSDAS